MSFWRHTKPINGNNVKKCGCFGQLRSSFSRIHLVDKCLILFMAVLLAQSSFSLFFHPGSNSEIVNIDVIIRTASASIFGYFLSANFIRHATAAEKIVQEPTPTKQIEPSAIPTNTPVGRIGFSVPTAELEHGQSENMTSSIQSVQVEVLTAHRIQIITATAIGIFCLISLTILRNVPEFMKNISTNASAAATIAQFRDFVSGCVGFLIGCPTNNSNRG